VDSVSGEINSLADSVIKTFTSAPAITRSLMSEADL